MNDVLIDTNVLVYALDNSSKYFKRATAFLTNEKISSSSLQKILANICSVQQAECGG